MRDEGGLMSENAAAMQATGTRRGNKRALAPPLLALALDRDAALPMQRQLYDQIREVILAGRLPPGARLPSSRSLARELGCSRNTVVTAFEDLLAEGYLEGHTGSGTYVSRVLPEALLGIVGKRTPSDHAADAAAAAADGALAPGLSRRGRALAALKRGGYVEVRAFLPSLPETAYFPFDVWSRLLARSWRQPAADMLRHGRAAGHLPLRAAIAQYLRAVRGLDCLAEQVIITSGAQQALDLAARGLLDSGDQVWTEDPGYLGLRGPLMAAGADVRPVPVDTEGFGLAAALERAPGARMAVVTPSHQYPLGVVMSLKRRLELLDWARGSGAWILEDDFDSEYRYSGRPLSALAGLEAGNRLRRVVYVGSFSKVLFPSLRIGYLVAPPDLVEPLARVRRALDDHPSAVVQPALAAFIEEGHFAAHVRRMRTLYGDRQAALVDSAARHFSGLLEVSPDEAGLHLVARLAPPLSARMDDTEASRRAASAGVTAPPLSGYCQGPAPAQGLLLGYAAFSAETIDAAAVRLAGALR